MEDGTLTATSEVATIFGVEIATDTSGATSFDWDDDVNLVSPEGINNPSDLSSAGDGTYIGLEDNVDGHDQVNVNINYQPEGGSKFFDCCNQVVTLTASELPSIRVVMMYELDGIAQPAIQVPRGDIIEFDLIAIDERDAFTVYADGAERTNELEIQLPTMLSFDTGKLPSNINKAYYRHESKRGMGWLIVITDN